MIDEQTADAREDTMLYREPTDDSDDNQVQDIWGQKLETRIVDASEVPAFISEGWYTHPQEIGGVTRQEADASFDDDRVKRHAGPALEAAEKLVEELTKERDGLTAERDEAVKDRDAVRQLAAENGKLADDRQAAIAKLTGDLKAAEELADAETKAKEAALAELADIKAAQETAKTPAPKPKSA